jgi:hypothetical protein
VTNTLDGGGGFFFGPGQTAEAVFLEAVVMATLPTSEEKTIVVIDDESSVAIASRQTGAESDGGHEALFVADFCVSIRHATNNPYGEFVRMCSTLHGSVLSPDSAFVPAVRGSSAPTAVRAGIVRAGARLLYAPSFFGPPTQRKTPQQSF